jgi:hypothetical protein
MAARHKYRLQCQTINKQNKLPCKASGIRMKNGNIRCRIHGGWSTGPRTLTGKLNALKNLKNINYEQVTANVRDKFSNSQRADER